MRHYTRSGIIILNDVTKELKNLNGLGIYLSKQTDINALKTLKLMILSYETGRIDKKFDITATNTYSSDTDKEKKENIAGNLSINPQNFALELLEYISKNYFINYGFECYENYSILETWLHSFKRMDFCDIDLFYKRYDMIDKKLDIIEFLITNGLLTKSQINNVLQTYQEILGNYTNFNKEQLQRLQQNINIMTDYYKLHNKISYSRELSKEEKNKEHKLIDDRFAIYKQPNKKIFNSCKENSERELQDYIMENEQCVYMLHKIPGLIKEKLIK